MTDPELHLAAILTRVVGWAFGGALVAMAAYEVWRIAGQRKRARERREILRILRDRGEI
jgi:hypothetical protein